MSLKVLIVDDEPLVRHGLGLMLRQCGVDIGEVLEAANGREALAIAAKQAPHIVFLDIRMPGLSGLEVMRELHACCPHAKVVVLTAYDRFDYAQEALRQGATDYLVKPLDEAQLCQALQRCLAALTAEAEQEARCAVSEAVCRSLEEALVLELVGKVKGRVKGEAELKGLLVQLLGREADFPQVCLVLEPQATHEPDWEVLRKLCTKIAAPWLVLSAVVEGRLVLLAQLPSQGGQVSKEDAVELGRRLRGGIKESTGLEVAIGIGTTCSHPGGLASSYGEALLALEAAADGHGPGGDLCLHFADLMGIRQPGWSYPWEKEEELLTAVKLGMAERARSLAMALLEEVLRNSPYAGERLARAVEILALVSRAALEARADPKAVLHFSCRQLRRLPGVGTAAALRQWMEVAMAGVASLVAEANRSRGEQLILQAEAYMRENLARNLTLEQVASKVYLSPAYFSTLFHKYKGCSFSSYLERLRVKAAVELLLTTDEPVYAVARAVGYHDANYFARVFRKVVGEPPSAFRRRRRTTPPETTPENFLPAGENF